MEKSRSEILSEIQETLAGLKARIAEVEERLSALEMAEEPVPAPVEEDMPDPAEPAPEVPVEPDIPAGPEDLDPIDISIDIEEVAPVEVQPAAPEAPAEEKPKRTRAARKPKKPVSTLTDDQIARIVKMAPGSIKKLKNTLAAQFTVADADAEIAALEANGVFSLDRDHIIWAPFTPKPATLSP